MKGILSASRGRLAEGLLDMLQILCGELQQMQALRLLPGEEITEFMEKLEAAIQKMDIGEDVVILCNLLSDSPCNCSVRLLQNAKYAEKISAITETNSCMVLEYIGSGVAGTDGEALVDTGHKGIVDFNKLLRERQAT